MCLFDIHFPKAEVRCVENESILGNLISKSNHVGFELIYREKPLLYPSLESNKKITLKPLDIDIASSKLAITYHIRFEAIVQTIAEFLKNRFIKNT